MGEGRQCPERGRVGREYTPELWFGASAPAGAHSEAGRSLGLAWHMRLREALGLGVSPALKTANDVNLRRVSCPQLSALSLLTGQAAPLYPTKIDFSSPQSMGKTSALVHFGCCNKMQQVTTEMPFL